MEIDTQILKGLIKGMVNGELNEAEFMELRKQPEFNKFVTDSMMALKDVTPILGSMNALYQHTATTFYLGYKCRQATEEVKSLNKMVD